MRWQTGILAIMIVMFLQGLAWSADPVAVLTEIRAGLGEVQVKLAAEWTAPQPLLVLQPGDQVRAAGDARAVLVFIGGRGAETVSAANLPYTVQAPTGESGPEKAERSSLLSVLRSGTCLIWAALTSKTVRSPSKML